MLIYISDKIIDQLAVIYMDNPVKACAVAEVCDKILDQSGHLISRVREVVEEVYKRNVDTKRYCYEFHDWCDNVKHCNYCTQCGIMLF